MCRAPGTRVDRSGCGTPLRRSRAYTDYAIRKARLPRGRNPMPLAGAVACLQCPMTAGTCSTRIILTSRALLRCGRHSIAMLRPSDLGCPSSTQGRRSRGQGLLSASDAEIDTQNTRCPIEPKAGRSGRAAEDRLIRNHIRPMLPLPHRARIVQAPNPAGGSDMPILSNLSAVYPLLIGLRANNV